MAKRVFIVSSGRLCVYNCGSSVSEPYEFVADDDGLTMFSVYLQRDSREPAYVLVDVVEEEFRVEAIPHVFGRDRRALVHNRLSRLFRDSSFSHAIAQGREKSGRKDDRYLFTAITRPELLTPWLDAINQNKVPLAGIYSLPLLTQQLVKPLKLASSQALLVTLQSSSALRQTFFKEGQLKVSRLAQLPNLHPSRYPSHVLSEVEKLRRYLNSLQLVAQDSPLDVYILGQERLLTDIKREAPDSVTTRYHPLDIQVVAKRLGLRGGYASPFSDALFAHFLTRKRGLTNHYANSTQTRYHGLYRARGALVAGGAVMLLGSLLWSGFKFVEGVITAHNTNTVAQQAEFYAERYRLARADLPELPAASRDIRLAVDVVDKLETYRSMPIGMMTTLGRGLAGYPSIKLDRLRWAAATDKDASVDVRLSAPDPRANRRRKKEQKVPEALYQIAEVSGRIEPFTGDYRQAFDLVRSFAETLRELGGVEEVTVQSLPLDIRSERSLSGDAQSVDADRDASFTIRLALRTKDYEPS